MRHILKLIGWLFGGHHANWISFDVILRTLYNVQRHDEWLIFAMVSLFSLTKKYNLISESSKSFECMMMTFYFMKMAHFSVTMFKCLEMFMSCILRMDSYHNHSWPLLISLKTSSFQMRSLSLSPKCISNFHASQMIHSIWYEISLTSRCIRLVYMRCRYKKIDPLIAMARVTN